MVRMSEHTGLISPYQLLIIAACTNTVGLMKGSHPRPADRCPFVLGHSIIQVTSFMQLGMLWRTQGAGRTRDGWTDRRSETNIPPNNFVVEGYNNDMVPNRNQATIILA